MVYSLALFGSLCRCFEVDSTESIWYKRGENSRTETLVLKLTPQSQYGIPAEDEVERTAMF